MFSLAWELYGVDECWFIGKWMCSDMRYYIDSIIPYWLYKPEGELLDRFFREHKEYPRSPRPISSVRMNWAGIMYGFYINYRGGWSRDLVEILPPLELLRRFSPLHETGFDNATIKLHDGVLGLEPKYDYKANCWPDEAAVVEAWYKEREYLRGKL
jgi:hypothetical protein